MFRRIVLNPPTVMLFCGSLLLGAGGAMMGAIGSSVWLTVAAFGLLSFVALAMGFARLAPTPATVEKELAARVWIRTPAHIQVTEDGLVYDHGPLHSRLQWAGLARVIETSHALILTEKPAPGALYYALPKRELDRTAAGHRGWRELLAGHASRY